MVEIDKERLPRHVAIIMDGNGRWAVRRGLTRVAGHRRGKDSVKEVVETARRLGIPYLSLYAFSSENWQRPKDEVSALMRFLRHYLVTELKRMMKNGIRLLTIGNMRRLPREVQLALRDVVEQTKRNTGMTVILAVSYGGREELTEQRRKDLVKHVKKTAEEYRVSVRQHRHDAIGMLKELHKERELTDDDLKKSQERVEHLTKEFVEKVDKLLKGKEEEIMAV